MIAEEIRGIRIPHELQGVPVRPVEEYVRARIAQFTEPFARLCNLTLQPAAIRQAAADTIADIPLPEYDSNPAEFRDLQLVFRHDCLSLGCLDPQCVLCEHNPQRRCNVNFAPKYLVGDILRAKCNAPIRVEVIDQATGFPVGEDMPNLSLQIAILDGNAYDARCLDGKLKQDLNFNSCTLLLNNRDTPLLGTGGGASHDDSSRVIVKSQRGVAHLPELYVSDSSEAMLSGRKPPLRLLVQAAHDQGSCISLRHAVSEGFVVATRRTRTAGKVEIPNVDDHVGKLEHMGKETVKKLRDIRRAGRCFGVDISLLSNCINKVGEFRKLTLLAEADGHLRQKLQQVLKLSKEKWDEAKDHAMRAVVADNRMRIWYSDVGSCSGGLLFACRLGIVDLERPVGLLQRKDQEGGQTMEAMLMAQQTPQQRHQVGIFQPLAVASWWQPGHSGWAIYPVDSDQFMSAGAMQPTWRHAADDGGGGSCKGPNEIASPVKGPRTGSERLSVSYHSNDILTEEEIRRNVDLTPLEELPSTSCMLTGSGAGVGGFPSTSSFQSADLEQCLSQAESIGRSSSFGIGNFGFTDGQELPDVSVHGGDSLIHGSASAAAIFHDVSGLCSSDIVSLPPASKLLPLLPMNQR